ncbi:M20/M25/M40 family metallo-hydrolase [Lentibacillus sp. CBA3610]|uniref:M20/M25/M40 family metallo-hydrolase n=1 Tax=Lentibacillus sp. CBA3610 TaxID=2518176 RepID=UPI001595A7D2|nr:M20/M25/M40 family metallo-hydrolase [Lentibacillus sp. CBA3610]QKY70173.1 M20/M25/M40 family metallo-hydrolase [Lentibacillus sp. CBA3610]
MDNRKWTTPEDLKNLLCELVSWNSETFSEGEKSFPEKTRDKLNALTYFREHPDRISLHQADLGRAYLTALYKHEDIRQTVVLVSHFDTVQTEEYGELQPLAYYPEKLTKALKAYKGILDPDAIQDLESGDYLFGRGTMDMKMGLAMHMALLEKASIEQWPINLLLVTVPDEEVNSSGMRSAVSTMADLQHTYDLDYQLFLNSEPSFTQKPGDTNHYIYSGTMGKVMPAALFYGKESHVGEPLKGMTANYIASFLTQRMEWNPRFQEEHLGEQTPLPVSLQQRDLKQYYSTQTPARAQALYNVFLMQRSANDIMDLFAQTANDAAKSCNAAYQKILKHEQTSGIGNVRVLRYNELETHARQHYGDAYVENIRAEVSADSTMDERDKSLQIADQLMISCQELAPAIVLLFAPPYYPAVNTSKETITKEAIQLLKDMGEQYGIDLKPIHYFNGICDLSYVNYQGTDDGLVSYEKNTPVWGMDYHIPFEIMQNLQAPVLNVGPFGKDPHQMTERLHKQNAFRYTPAMLEGLINRLFC